MDVFVLFLEFYDGMGWMLGAPLNAGLQTYDLNDALLSGLSFSLSGLDLLMNKMAPAATAPHRLVRAIAEPLTIFNTS